MKRELKSAEEELLFSVPLIKVKYENNSEAQGTSFFVSYKTEFENQKKEMVFLVTNKHVIENSISQKIYLHYKDKNGYPVLDKHKEIDLQKSEHNWISDKNSDITILNLSASIEKYKDLYFKTIPLFLEKLQPKESDIDVIEDVIFIGYPNGLYDKKNLLPIVRKGITASSYNFDFDGEPKFLIDASVFQGSSGSPVFILDTGKFVDGKKVNLAGNRVYFLGILASVYFKDDKHIVDEKAHFTRQMIDIGVVYKSFEVEKLIKKYIKDLNIFFEELDKILKIKNEKTINIKLEKLFLKYPFLNSYTNKQILPKNEINFKNEEIEVIKEWIEDNSSFVSKIRETIANDFKNSDLEIIKKAKIISNLFNKYDSDYPKNITVSRGLRFDISDEIDKKYFKNLYEIFYDSFFNKSEIIFDFAPMSASKNRDIAEGFAISENEKFFSIIIDFKLRYTNEIDLSIIDANEQEILINGDLIYKVVSFEIEAEQNIYFVELEEVQNG